MLAKVAHDASDQKSQFDNELAKATLDASDMKSQYDKLAADNVEQASTWATLRTK